MTHPTIGQPFLGKLVQTRGETTTTMSYIIVGGSEKEAKAFLDKFAQGFACEPEEAEEGEHGWKAPGSDTSFVAGDLAAISLPTFLELRKHLPVRCAPDVIPPSQLSFGFGELVDAAYAVVASSNHGGCLDDISSVSTAVVSRLSAALHQLPPSAQAPT